MKGWLVYDEVGKLRNEWFINHIDELKGKYNLDIELKVISSIKDIGNQSLPNFAIIRTINHPLSAYLAKKNVKLFNNEKTSFYANDKYNTYLLCKKLGIEVMDTELLVENTPKMKLPYIVKSVDGHGGSEVFLVKSEEELQNAREVLKNKKSVVQTLCTTLGKDMRVYLLGGNIVTAILRSSENDFRSNYSLGGKVQKVCVTKRQQEIVEKICDELKCDYVGIDFIINNGEYVLNEIEDVVGARMVYAVEEFDIVDMWLKYISQQLNQKT